MQCAQQFFIPPYARSSRDAVRTAVFHSTMHMLITWCSAHSSFSFHNAHAHHLMQCAQQFFIPPYTSSSLWCTVHHSFSFHHTHAHHVMQCAHQFFIPQCTRSSLDAVRTTFFYSTIHTLLTLMHCAQQFFIPPYIRSSLDALRTTGLHSTIHTLIKSCSAHNSFLFHNAHTHHLMQCAQQFFIPPYARLSLDAVCTPLFYSTIHTLITWCTLYNSVLSHNATLITWCTAHRSFLVRQCTRTSHDAVRTRAAVISIMYLSLLHLFVHKLHSVILILTLSWWTAFLLGRARMRMQRMTMSFIGHVWLYIPDARCVLLSQGKTEGICWCEEH